MKRLLLVFMALAYFLVAALPANAGEGVPGPELSLEKAMDLAIKNSDALRMADIDIERVFVIREKSADVVKYVPIGSGTQNPVGVANFSSLVANDLKWRSAKKSKDGQIDALVYSVCQSYSNVLNVQEKIKASETALASIQWKARVARIGMVVGTVSQTELVMADAQLEKAKNTLEASRKELDDAYAKLNFLTGMRPEDRPVLTDTLAYSPLEVINLEAEANRAVDESPAVWIANSNVDAVLQTKDFSNPSEVGQYDYNKTKLSAAVTKDNTKNIVRSYYYSIKQMEEQYGALKESITVLEESLRLQKIRYDVGMVTKGELLAAEADLAQARQGLFELVCRHELAKIAFKKPWSVGGVTG